MIRRICTDHGLVSDCLVVVRLDVPGGIALCTFSDSCNRGRGSRVALGETVGSRPFRPDKVYLEEDGDPTSELVVIMVMSLPSRPS
jgi:hypothetical protein